MARRVAWHRQPFWAKPRERLASVVLPAFEAAVAKASCADLSRLHKEASDLLLATQPSTKRQTPELAALHARVVAARHAAFLRCGPLGRGR